MLTLTKMQRAHLAAEGAALKEGRVFMTQKPRRLRGRDFHYQFDAHVKAWRNHKIDECMDNFIATYTPHLVAYAGRVG